MQDRSLRPWCGSAGKLCHLDRFRHDVVVRPLTLGARFGRQF
jgi:hypothetical protein